MMKLGYQQATIVFCVDLTAPNSEMIPIANLLIGEAEGRQVSGVALFVPDHLDPLTKAVLNDTHQLVRRYVDEAFMCRSPAAPLSEVLARVSHSLRDSMHVSAIGEPAEVQVAELGQLGGAVVHLLYRGLVAALADPTSGGDPPATVTGGVERERMAASVDPESLKSLLGLEVVVKGTVAFRPSGRPQRIEISHVARVGARDVRHELLVLPSEGLDRYFGQWPGDEDDEQVFAALRELS